MKNSQELVEEIKQRLSNKQISVKEMLSNCELNINTLSTMKNREGYPRLEAIAKIAQFLNCSIDDLLGLSDTEKAENKLTDKEIELLKLFDTVPNDKKEQVLDLFKSQIDLIK